MRNTPSITRPDDFVHGDDGVLTIREYFACQIMVGLVANPHFANPGPSEARQAVKMADVLIAELNMTSKGNDSTKSS